MKVVQVDSIIMGPYVSKWRHPIWWWKMRHLRADIEAEQSVLSANLTQRFNELEEEAFLYGNTPPDRIGEELQNPSSDFVVD